MEGKRMAADPIHLINNSAITQGITFIYPMLWPGDFSLWLPAASIKTDTEERGGIVKAHFSFLPLIYPHLREEDGVLCTLITLLLDEDDSIPSELPSTKYQGEKHFLKRGADASGVPFTYVWNLTLTSPDADKIVKGTNIGYVQVKPR
jgi:hypothetical protein